MLRVSAIFASSIFWLFFLIRGEFFFIRIEIERCHEDPVSWAETELKQRQQLEKNREEYDNINSLLGENAPSSIDEYQRVKYNKTEEYIQLKTNVRDVEWMKKSKKKYH